MPWATCSGGLCPKLAVTSVFDQAQQLLSPTQVGVGTRGGAEATIHSIKRTVRRFPGLSVMQVDLVNAYGEAERGRALDQVAEHFPTIYRWVYKSYGGRNIMFFGDKPIEATKGWQQGDPLSCLLFALTLRPITEEIKEKVKGLKLHVWFLDDGHVVGTLDQLREVARILVEQGPSQGLILSRVGTADDPKSRIWSGQAYLAEDPLGMGIPVERGRGIIVLGSPVGDQTFIEETVARRIKKIEELTEKLGDMEDSHMEFVLLRSTLSLPKLTYILRTVDPTPLRHLWQYFDGITRAGLGRIVAGPVSDSTWEEVKKGLGDGGVGFRGAADHCIAAFVASVCGTWPLVQELMGIQGEVGLVGEGGYSPASGLPEEEVETIQKEVREEVVVQLAEAMGRPREDLSWEELMGFNQKALSTFIDARNAHIHTTRIDREGNTREMARVRALTQPNAGAWLCASPNPKTGSHLKSQDFVLCLKYRLGLPIYREGAHCPLCKMEMDVFGCHAVNCSNGSGRAGRHNAVRDIVVDSARSACLSPVVEQQGLIDGTRMWPGDITLPGFPQGRDTLIDVTVVNPLQQERVDEASHTPGAAMREAKTKKGGLQEGQAQG